MRVLLVDDHRVMLAGLSALLREQDWVTDIDTAASLDQARSVLEDASPDVVVLDLRLGGESGLDLITPLRQRDPAPRIIVLTMSADLDDARDAIARGASGYVVKDDGPDEVIAAIRVVAGGGMVFSDAASRALVPPRRGRTPQLAERDREMLGLLAQGLTNEQIARRLFLSPKTIRNRLSDLYRRLGVTNRAEAVAVAYELGH